MSPLSPLTEPMQGEYIVKIPFAKKVSSRFIIVSGKKRDKFYEMVIFLKNFKKIGHSKCILTPKASM